MRSLSAGMVFDERPPRLPMEVVMVSPDDDRAARWLTTVEVCQTFRVSLRTVQEMTWYYAAGPVALLDNIVSLVSTSAGVRPPPPPPPSNTRPPLEAAVQNAQQQTVTVLPPATPVLPAVAAGNVPAAGNRVGSIGSLLVTEIRSQQTGSETQGSGTSQSGEAQEQGGGDSALLAQVSQSGDALGMLKVFVVDGGVLLPDAAGTERE